ncbi:DUF58 domain-containing protein [Nocardioides sp. ChNu-153]|uniref:DUF58 domain-containing protein n=1 Tax=unclassified Nocardioides TaxID=2615069 RepID=UPI002405443A|nr:MULTISPECIES: DUF58 domain-containing protein [unclassified Nocardioides]MDF9717696.1 DUF58 domain-containing protein [Nocardioides sp. ChNu-99]MDN7121439.1 DUF58 domain-containing protein [Nocardioides sp. ChNu-153]
MRALRSLRHALAVVDPLGWAVACLGVLAGVVAVVAGWREAGVVAVACLLLLVLAAPFVLGRTRVRVDVTAEPRRVVAGASVAVGVVVTNTASRRLLPVTLALPVGASVHRYALPALRPGAAHLEDLLLRTERRGVVAVGPASTRRGDPVGVFSRDVVWTDVQEVLVRPVMVPLESLGAGLLRDLEGVTTDAVTSSDLAFHALREYAPGDDLRHVHWRSSAKVGQLLVRQYQDTRRSHATVVVDDDPAAWGDDDELETAMGVAASIVARATLDDFAATFVCGRQVVTGTDGNQVLDAVCRAATEGRGLLAGAQEAARVAPDTSLLFLLGGTGTSFATLTRAAATHGPQVRRLGLLVDPAARAHVREAGDVPVLTLARRDDLAPLLRWGAS